jgi:hypothetical protein
MKKIMWENWNEKEKELLEPAQDPFLLPNDIDNEEQNEIEQLLSSSSMLSPMIDFQQPIIHTPFGVVPSDSVLKPSDRWECWMGYTNFDLTHQVSDKIKVINGVEALKIMSRYTFCVGVGKMFQFTSVRKEIENAICKQ